MNLLHSTATPAANAGLVSKRLTRMLIVPQRVAPPPVGYFCGFKLGLQLKLLLIFECLPRAGGFASYKEL